MPRIGLHSSLLAAFFLLLPLAASGQAVAAEETSEAVGAPTPAEAFQELTDRIRQADGELVELIEQLSKAEGEEFEIVRSRIAEIADRQQGDLGELVGRLTNPDADDDLTLMEQRGEQLLRRSSRHLRSFIHAFRTALERAAESRSELDVSEVQTFEHRMAEDTHQLDRFYLELFNLVADFEGLDLDATEERVFLEEELSERGKNLVELLKLTKERLAQAKSRVRAAPADSALQTRVFAAEERYESNKMSLLATIHMMRTLGFDYVDLEVRALELTGEVTPDALQADVAVGLVERELNRARTYFAEHGPRLFLRALVIFVIVLSFWLLSRLTRAIVARVAKRRRLSNSQLLTDMAVNSIGRLVLLSGVILALSLLGIDLGPILAGLGIVGLVIGFALQDTLANFAAGAMILAYRPFDVGDFIEAAGVTGTVKDMTPVSTRILTPDSQTLLVPNGKIWGDVIRNFTAEPQRRVDMVIGISYQDDIPKAERVLAEILADEEKVLSEPAPVIRLHQLNDSSVDFVVRPWARTEDFWEVHWNITREVKLRFDREGISFPFPQRDIRVINASDSPEAPLGREIGTPEPRVERDRTADP